MAWNRNMDVLTTRLATILVGNVVGFAVGAGSAHAPSGAGQKVADCIKGGESAEKAAAGGVFADLHADLNFGKSFKKVTGGVTGTGVKFGGFGLEKARLVHEYKNGKIKLDWMHVEYDERGNSYYMIEDPKTYRPPQDGGRCVQLKQSFGNVCVIPDADGRGFHIKAEVALEKEVPSQPC